MSILIDFENNTITFDFKGKKATKTLGTPLKTPYMISRSTTFVYNDDNDNEMVNISWKLWNNIEQFVKVETYDGKKWTPTTQWSYNAQPQPGTSQTTDIKCWGQREFNLHVIQSPYGDWAYK